MHAAVTGLHSLHVPWLWLQGRTKKGHVCWTLKPQDVALQTATPAQRNAHSQGNFLLFVRKQLRMRADDR